MTNRRDRTPGPRTDRPGGDRRRAARAAALGWWLLLLAPAAPMPGVAAAPDVAPDGCPVPAEMLDAPPLPGAAGALRRGELRLLVVGSSSALGSGGSGMAASYPAQLEALLRRRLPGVRVAVAAVGARGATAADGLRAIEAAIRPQSSGGVPERPHLVVWQTGTVEAARALDPAELAATLQDGAARLREARVDLVLVDPQFSRFLRSNADVEPYREAMRLAAAAAAAGLFRRWDAMQGWAEAETLDVERAPRERRVAEVDRLNACVARALADLIADGVADAR